MRRAGLPNLGDTFFINAALQALRPLLSSSFDLETGTLAAQAADVALHAVRGLLADMGTWLHFVMSPQSALRSVDPRAGNAPAPCIQHCVSKCCLAIAQLGPRP